MEKRNEFYPSLIFVFASLFILEVTLSFRSVVGINYYDIYNFTLNPTHSGLNGQNIRVAGACVSFFLAIAGVITWPGIQRCLSRRWLIIFLFILAFMIRLSVSFSFYGTYDIASYKLVVDIIHEGKIVYAETTRYNYSPLWGFVLIGVDFLSNWFKIPFPSLVKLPAIISDLLIGFLLYKHARRQDDAEIRSLDVILLWLFNPISILISSYHGQFDALWLLFAFGAFILYQSPRWQELSTVALSLGVLIKTIPIIFLPVYLIRSKKISEAANFLLVPILPLMIAIFPYYLASPDGILRNVISYHSEVGLWGWTFILDKWMEMGINHFGKVPFLFSILSSHSLYLLLIVLGLVVVTTRHVPILKSLTLVILSFYVFSNGFALQYTVWLLPFGIALRDPRIGLYTLFASFWLLVSYFFTYAHPGQLIQTLSSINFVRWAGVPAYLICVYWFISLFRSCFLERAIRSDFT